MSYRQPQRGSIQLPANNDNRTFNNTQSNRTLNNSRSNRSSMHNMRRAMPPRLQQYQRNRRKFASKAYGIAILAMLISTAQWIPFYLIDGTRDFFITYFYVSMLFLFLALLLIGVFIFIESIRFKFPLNWLVALLIVECITLGMIGAFVAHSNLMIFGLSLALAFLLTLAFVLFGVIIPHDFTLDVVVLFLVSVIFFIGSVFFVMLHVLMNVPGTEFVYSIFVIISVGLFTMYHAQTINGGRYAEMRLTDYLLAALIIFHDFVLFLISVFLIVVSIWCRYTDWQYESNNK